MFLFSKICGLCLRPIQPHIKRVEGRCKAVEARSWQHTPNLAMWSRMSGSIPSLPHIRFAKIISWNWSILMFVKVQNRLHKKIKRFVCCQKVICSEILTVGIIPSSSSSSSSIGTTTHCGLWPVEQCPSIFSYLQPTLSIFSLPALKDLFLLPLSIFSWVFRFFSSLPVLEWRSLWASYPPPFSLRGKYNTNIPKTSSCHSGVFRFAL